jgi:TonB family protein
MKYRRLLVVIVWLLASTLSSAQQPTAVSSNTLNYEDGVIENGVYSNQCFGLSFPIPSGWQVSSGRVGTGLKARHLSGGGLGLLVIERHWENPLRDRITLMAREITAQDRAVDIVSHAVHVQTDARPNRELIRDAFAVDYAGMRFFRADYTEQLHDGGTMYMADMFTIFRGYLIGEDLISASQEGLDQAANSVQGIVFREDRIDSRCVTGSPVHLPRNMSKDEIVRKVAPNYPDDARKAHIRGDVILKTVVDKNGDVEDVTAVSGDPMLIGAAIEAVKQWKFKPYLVKGGPVTFETQIDVDFLDQEIAPGVSAGLLIKRVQPQYPDDARRARLQGQVVLNATIDKEGNVLDLSLVSGHPMLAPAAIKAVKQWRYKPYLFNNEPVEVETQIKVNFTLSEH